MIPTRETARKLCVPLTPEMHDELQQHCADQGLQMTTLVRSLLRASMDEAQEECSLSRADRAGCVFRDQLRVLQRDSTIPAALRAEINAVADAAHSLSVRLWELKVEREEEA